MKPYGKRCYIHRNCPCCREYDDIHGRRRPRSATIKAAVRARTKKMRRKILVTDDLG